MNEDFILTAIKPYINSKKELTYEDFDCLFNVLTRQEQYEVLSILQAVGIILVGEKSGDNILNNNNCYQENKPKTIILKKKSREADLNKNKESKKTLKRESYTKLLHKLLKESNENLVVIYQQTKSELYIQALIAKNINFLKKEAYKIGKYYNHGFDDNELVHLAKIGFVKGCLRYDINKNHNLLTYAGWWVKQFVIREIIDYGFLIRLPVHNWELIKKVSKIMSRYNEEESIEDLLVVNNISQKKYLEVKQWQQQYLSVASLDARIQNCENTHLIDFISPKNYCLISKYETPEKFVEQKILIKYVNYLLKGLKTKEKEIIILRFGLNNTSGMTLDQIGKRYGISRERVRQIEEKAKRKIYHVLINQLNRNDEYLKSMSNSCIVEMNKDYFFKKNNISYIPGYKEIIDRILSLYPEEQDYEVLYTKVKECAMQNAYIISSINKSNVISKLKDEKRKHNANICRT